MSRAAEKVRVVMDRLEAWQDGARVAALSAEERHDEDGLKYARAMFGNYGRCARLLGEAIADMEGHGS